MESAVYPKERIYFVISLIVSIILYLLLIVSIVGLVYLIMGAIITLFTHGIFIGNIRGNGIKLSEHQFPEAYQIAKKLSNEMGFFQVPDIYIMESGGLINAFATRFMGRNFIVIYTDVLELAYEEGEDALAFVICHELAHIKRKHLSRRWILLPANFMPFLGSAYSRACEYTCDLVGAYHVPKGAISGLLVLAAGKKLYRKVNVAAISHQAKDEGGFWVWFSEIISTHPNLAKRVRFIANEQLKFNYDATKSYVSQA